MKLNNITKVENLKEFVRFVVVGIIATILHYGIYIILGLVGLKYNSAYTIGYGISFIFNFVASNYFTFKTNPSIKSGAKFTGSHIINYLLQMVVLNLLIYTKLPKNIAPVFVFAICIPTNFLLVRISLKDNKKKIEV